MSCLENEAAGPIAVAGIMHGSVLSTVSGCMALQQKDGSQAPAKDEEETDRSCRDTVGRAEPKKKKTSVAAEKAPKKKTGAALGLKAKGAQKVKA